MTTSYIACAILCVIAMFTLSRGWVKTGIAFVLLTGVMVATTNIGPNLQHGVQAGVDGTISTVKAFFH
jgi:hypothetical protein